jgi:hypothetical protein
MVLPKSTGGDVAVPFPVDVVGFRPIIPVPSEGVLVTAVLSVFCNILIGFSRFTISGFTRTALVTGVSTFLVLSWAAILVVATHSE